MISNSRTVEKITHIIFPFVVKWFFLWSINFETRKNQTRIYLVQKELKGVMMSKIKINILQERLLFDTVTPVGLYPQLKASDRKAIINSIAGTFKQEQEL